MRGGFDSDLLREIVTLFCLSSPVDDEIAQNDFSGISICVAVIYLLRGRRSGETNPWIQTQFLTDFH